MRRLIGYAQYLLLLALVAFYTVTGQRDRLEKLIP